MTGMNRPIKRVALAALVMFLILLVDVNYLQAVQAPSLASKPENGRATAEQNKVQRGNIVTADGVTIATSKATGGSQYPWQRVYPAGPIYAPVTGYKSVYSSQAQAPNYATGVERAENDLLTGTGSQLAFRNFIDTLTNKPQQGATVQTTVNSKAQDVAYQQLQAALQGKTFNGKQAVGGVVALNPSTGAILAMASYPSYNPNELAVQNTTTLNKVDNQLDSEDPSPLLNNATQTTLPPGSTFKIVTTSAWYDKSSSNTPEVAVASPQPLTLPNGNTLSNDAGEICGTGAPTTPVIYAFAQSCNTPFADLGIQLGGSTIKSMADNYGLNSTLNIPGVTVAPSNFTAESDPSFTAYDAIGQHDTTETPLP